MTTQLGYFDLFDQAKSAVARRELELGRTLFLKALEVKPDAVDALYGLATVCFLLNDHDAAIEYYNRIREYDATHAGAEVNLGAIYNIKHDYEKAIHHLRRGIQLDPKRSEAYYNLGVAYRKVGRIELALEAFRSSYQYNPRRFEAALSLANVYFELDRFEQAQQYYKRALEIKPTDPRARDGLLRCDTKIKEASANSTAELEVGSTWDSMIEADLLDRTLNPQSDFDCLSKLHAASGEAKRLTESWTRLMVELDTSIRSLAIGITSGHPGTDYVDALTRFRKATDEMHEVRSHLEKTMGTLCDLREKLIGADSPAGQA